MLRPGWGYQGKEASWRAAAASSVNGSSGLWISGCFHPRGTALPVCSGIRFHAHKHESDGRAESEGSVNKGSWMKVTAHGYARRPCSTHERQKVRGHGQ